MKGFLHYGRNDNNVMASRAQYCHFELVVKSHHNTHLAHKTQSEGINEYGNAGR